MGFLFFFRTIFLGFKCMRVNNQKFWLELAERKQGYLKPWLGFRVTYGAVRRSRKLGFLKREATNRGLVDEGKREVFGV
jgi:hypothetical protein